MFSDLRQAVRHVASAPRLTAVIVASLALGIGANAAVFSTIDALLFRPPPGVADAATLVDIYTSQVNGGSYGLSSFGDYESITSTPGLQAAAIDDLADQAVRSGDRAAARRVAAVTSGFWSLLRLAPHSGHWTTGGAVLSFDAWQALGGDADIVGRTVNVAGRDYVVSAIAPRGFRGLHLDRVYDVWVPLDTTAASAGGRGYRHLRLIGRLTAGRLDALQSALSSLAASLARAYPRTNLGTLRTADQPRRFTAAPYSRLDPALRWRTVLLGLALLAVTALMLLSACVNTGSLLLSRGIARRTELTIKIALGADRRRLIRQLLTESVLLTGAGASLGLFCAAWTAGAIPALFAPDHARLLDAHVDPRVMAAAMGAAVVTGILCGLAPALVSTRALSAETLRGDAARIGERPGGARLRLVLVGAQLALSTIFLIAAALLSTVIDTALGSQRSRAAGELTVASIELPPGGSSDADYRAAATAELRSLPSVDVIGWVSSPPLARTARRTFRLARGETAEVVEIDVNFATSDYFRALYIPVIEGRTFAANDAAERDDVVIVNDAVAQRYFVGRAVGRLLTDMNGRAVEIVGVVQTRSYRAFAGPPVPMVYYPMSRTIGRAFAAVVRSKAYVSADAPVSAALARVGAARNIDVLSFDAYLARALATDYLIAWLVEACAMAALALAVIGVYGVLGDLVRRRRREIGLRLALGARPRQVLQGVLGPALLPTLVGIAAGVSGAEIATRAARSFVYELPVLEPGVVLATTAVLIVVVAAAVLPQARRVTRINPIVVLRD